MNVKSLTGAMWTRTVSLLFAASISSSGLLAEEAKSPSAPDSGSSHSQLVHSGPDGKLVYQPDAKGNTIPDFSNCGYLGGGVALPNVAVRVTLKPEPGTADDTARVQAASEAVSKMPANAAGFRGAVLLKQGQYRIGGALRIAASGVVLRGEGQAENGTVLVATGTKRRTLIAVQGSSGPKANSGSRQSITSEYVPVGARTFEVRDGLKFKVGDSVIVSRNGNEAWIHEIGMDRIAPRPGNPSSTRQWAPFSLPFDRVITSVAGNRLTVDAPIACAIEARWGGGDIWRYDDAGRIEQCGVENLRGDSDFDRTVTEQQRDQKYFADEAHAIQLVSFDNARNCWARDLTAVHFYHGVSAIERNAKWVTVQDCRSLEPVSKITGGRRYPFSINGQLSLVQRCYSREGRHAFAVGSRVPGPNVFLDCRSEQDYATSEPHHRWSVGGLFDCLDAQIIFQDRQYMGSGHGWAGANYVAWNCTGSLVCQQPPTAQNYAIGFVGKHGRGAFERSEGWWESEGRHVTPRSLYLKQLEDRLGPAAIANVTAKPSGQ